MSDRPTRCGAGETVRCPRVSQARQEVCGAPGSPARRAGRGAPATGKPSTPRRNGAVR